MSDPTQPTPQPPPQTGWQQPPTEWQTPSPPVKRKLGCLSTIGVIALVGLGLIVLLVVVAALMANTDDDGDDGASNSDTQADGASEKDVYAVGETATTSGMDVTVHEVVDPWDSSNEFETPQAGHRFVAVEATIASTSDELEPWSSLLGAELMDSESRPWDVALAGTDLPALDGDVPPDGERRGWVVFEVGEDAAGLMLRLKGSVTATGAVFDLDGS